MNASQPPIAPTSAGAEMAAVAKRVARAIGRHHPRTWSQLVVCVTPEAVTVRPRAELSAELAAGGCDELAHECRARRVPLGSLLAYLLVDEPHASGVRFLVLNLRGARR